MEDLRSALVTYVRRKFTNIDGIYQQAEDIVQDAWLAVTKPEQQKTT